ncbi:hypothetical protein IW146_001873 [Coemansia sp. RSA 922]|nr:hypothetical protein H4S03_001358 [Coemansia sp. S3946]KAJ2115999.1 hypothetical protein IW146_001873 [Coemansia sp. RSA 922]
MSTSASQLRRERRKRQQKRQQQQLCTTQSKAATLPSVILRLIFAYLHQRPPRDSVHTLMYGYLQRLQELSSVNYQWRSVAKQLFYRVAFVVVGKPKYGVDGRYGIGVISNIRLIRNVGEIDSVRELQIDMRCGAHLLNSLRNILLEEGLGASSWPGVEQLLINMFDTTSYSDNVSKAACTPETVKAFNNLLSQALPSLREIDYTGFSDIPQNRFNPFAPLIKERLYGPVPIRVLRLYSECELKLNGRVGDPDAPIAPIALERLSINYQIPFARSVLPIMLANTLVELNFGSTFTDHIWDSFVVDGASGSPDGHLVFSRLESLSLSFLMGMELDSPLSVLSLYDPHSFFQSMRLGTLHFPVLTSLGINYFPFDLSQFLSLFASSPISKLTISGERSRIPDDLDLSQFGKLRSLCLLHYDPREPGEQDQPGNACAVLSSVFATCSPGVQRLTLVMSKNGLIGPQLTTPVFANSLGTLTLGGNITLREVELLLPLFPCLQRLWVSAAVCPPVSSPSVLVQEYRRLNTLQQLPPLNTSVRYLRAEQQRYFAPLPTWPGTRSLPPSKIGEESQYRGMLLVLGSRLPSLVNLQVSEGSLGAVEKSIQALVKSDLAPDRIGHLQRLQLGIKVELFRTFT